MYIGSYQEYLNAGGKASQSDYNAYNGIGGGSNNAFTYQPTGTPPPAETMNARDTPDRGLMKSTGFDRTLAGKGLMAQSRFVNDLLFGRGKGWPGGIRPGMGNRWVEQPYGDGYYETYVADQELNPSGQPSWVGTQSDYDNWMNQGGGRQLVRNRQIDMLNQNAYGRQGNDIRFGTQPNQWGNHTMSNAFSR